MMKHIAYVTILTLAICSTTGCPRQAGPAGESNLAAGEFCPPKDCIPDCSKFELCACLMQCDFSGKDLSGANLSLANLNGANLSGANLSGADLRKSTLH